MADINPKQYVGTDMKKTDEIKQQFSLDVRYASSRLTEFFNIYNLHFISTSTDGGQLIENPSKGLAIVFRGSITIKSPSGTGIAIYFSSKDFIQNTKNQRIKTSFDIVNHTITLTPLDPNREGGGGLGLYEVSMVENPLGRYRFDSKRILLSSFNPSANNLVPQNDKDQQPIILNQNFIDDYGDVVEYQFLNQLSGLKTIPLYHIQEGKNIKTMQLLTFNCNTDKEGNDQNYTFNFPIQYNKKKSSNLGAGGTQPKVYPILVADKLNEIDYDHNNIETMKHKLTIGNNQLIGDSDTPNSVSYHLEHNDLVLIYLRKQGTGIPITSEPLGKNLDKAYNYIVSDPTKAALKFEDLIIASIPFSSQPKDGIFSGENVYDTFKDSFIDSKFFRSIILSHNFEQTFTGYDGILEKDQHKQNNGTTTISIGQYKDLSPSLNTDLVSVLPVTCSVTNFCTFTNCSKTGVKIHEDFITRKIDIHAQHHNSGGDQDNKAAVTTHILSSLGSLPDICYKYGDNDGSTSTKTSKVVNGVYSYIERFNTPGDIPPYNYEHKVTGEAKTIQDRFPTYGYGIMIGRNGKLIDVLNPPILISHYYTSEARGKVQITNPNKHTVNCAFNNNTQKIAPNETIFINMNKEGVYKCTFTDEDGNSVSKDIKLIIELTAPDGSYTGRDTAQESIFTLHNYNGIKVILQTGFLNFADCTPGILETIPSTVEIKNDYFIIDPHSQITIKGVKTSNPQDTFPLRFTNVDRTVFSDLIYPIKTSD